MAQNGKDPPSVAKSAEEEKMEREVVVLKPGKKIVRVPERLSKDGCGY